MRVVILIAIAILFQEQTQAQLFGKRDISIQQGFMNFHPQSLNNDYNRNSKKSWVTEIDRNLNLTRFSSLNYGLGLGAYRNPDTSFMPFDAHNFMRIKFGLVLHLPQKYEPRNWSPKNFNPFFKAAYNQDILGADYQKTMGSRLSSSFKLGFGAVIKISHHIGLIYEFSHNQRVNPDYRTFYQHNFGLIINLDTPYLPY